MEIKKGISKEIFREYDIRGEYLTQIDEDTAYTIGLAFGTRIKHLNKEICTVGHDNRLSGEVLTKALIKGITDTGVNVLYFGLVTTPMYYFGSLKYKIDTGIMVTASHNPVNDNGFKISFGGYENSVGEDIYSLYDDCVSANFSYGKGIVKSVNIRREYVSRILKGININKKLKVVIDPGNASASIIVRDIFDKLNITPIYINDISNGAFPNHHPDPSVDENMIDLKNKVLEQNADIGIAFDGDADRVGFVNEVGEIVKIDTFMAIVWDDIMDKVSNKTALFDVKCSKLLEDEINKLGGSVYINRTGAPYQRMMVRKLDLAFGGELSGHVFFRDRFDGYDDGIYAGIRMLEILSNSDLPFSKLDDNFSKYYSTPEIKVRVDDNNKFNIVDKVKNYCIMKNYDILTIDGVRVNFKDGFALVRASNTGPNLTLRFEALDEDRLNEIKDEFEGLIREIC